jgi:hypothetical protein
VFLPAGDRAGIERLVGYMTRCPFSLSRLVKVTQTWADSVAEAAETLNSSLAAADQERKRRQKPFLALAPCGCKAAKPSKRCFAGDQWGGAESRGK